MTSTTPTALTSASTPGPVGASTRTPEASNSASHAVVSQQEPSQSFRSSIFPSTFDSQDNSSSTNTPPLSFPPSTAFTFLPELYALISRLKPLEGTPQFKGSTTGSSRALTSSPLLNRDAVSTAITNKQPDSTADIKATSDAKATTTAATSDGTTTAITKTNTNTSALEIKDLPEHAYEIKQAIQAAREIVSNLPDINRTIAEQEKEIKVLQGRLNGFRKRNGELAKLAMAGSADTTSDDSAAGQQVKVKIETGESQDVVMKSVEEAG